MRFNLYDASFNDKDYDDMSLDDAEFYDVDSNRVMN
ncbi:hypothetical protein ABIE35_001601 [Paenarthrobacter sp. 4246]